MSVTVPQPSLNAVHAKIASKAMSYSAFVSIVQDINNGLYSGPQIASFLTASAAHPLSRREIFDLTKAMIRVGPCLKWEDGVTVDKHCVGGLPGNRTTPIIVAILSALGVRIAKTSSRAITSAAGTADVMEVLAPVHLTIDRMKDVVEQTGGCIIWGGAVGLSPVDDELVRIAREIGVDGEGQLVSSILSKKLAAGSTHVLIDIPVGPTAKIKTQAEARKLEQTFLIISKALKISCDVEITDGLQPIGCGIGPALEARDVIAVLQNLDTAPPDLRDKAVYLAGKVMELAGLAAKDAGKGKALACLSSGQAWESFKRICAAQGGMRDIPKARYCHTIVATHSGMVESMDNKYIAKLARIAGAPDDKTAGVDLHMSIGSAVALGQALLTIHSGSRVGLKNAIEEASKRLAIRILDPLRLEGDCI